jgi:uncharacterized RDD family membrane protein YckC
VPGPRDAQEPAAAPAPSAPGRHPLRSLPLPAVRGVQFGIDFGLSTLLCLLPMSVVLVLPRNPDGTLGDLLLSIPMIGLAMALAVALSWWYWCVLPVRRGGRTPAMGWFGLRVIGDGGQRVGVSAMTLRWLGLLVDAMLAGLVGLAAMLLTARDQRVGDLLAATLVVRAGPGEGATAADPGTVPGTAVEPTDPAT